MKPIKAWDDVDMSLAELAQIDQAIERDQNEMNRLCQEIKERYGSQIKIYEAVKKQLIEALGAFFIAHEDDPEVKGKTYDGQYGKCGLRLTPPSVKPIGKMTWERVLSRIIDLGYKNKLLRPLVHSIKDIDRETLASDRVDEGTRKAVGVRLHQEERFWYEAK